jgi:hypothetical protein
MHIYNWYQSITTSIPLYTWVRHNLCTRHIPFLSLADFSLLPFAPLVPLSPLFYLLGTLLVVTGSVHLVPRLLVN